MKKILSVLLIGFILLVNFTSCEGIRSCVLRSGRTDLYSIANFSVPFVEGDFDWDRAEELERDSYGRILFKYSSSSRMMYDYCGENVRAVLICQKVDEKYAYYYDNYDFIFLQENESLSSKNIEDLKAKNDWNKPLDDSKMTKVTNSFKPYIYEIPYDIDPLDNISVHLPKDNISKNPNVKYNYDILAVDENQRQLYVVREYVKNSKDDYTFYDSYFAICDEYIQLLSIDNEPCIMKIDDIAHCQDDMRAIKERCQWRANRSELSQQDYTGNVVSGGGGYIAESGGMFYFANKDDQSKLYQMNKNFVKEKLSDLANDSAAINLQPYGDYLFYLHNTKTDDPDNPWIDTLYSYNLTTRRETKVLDENICSYIIHDDKIYYSTKDTKRLYKANLDGSSPEPLTDKEQWLPVSIQYNNDSLYYGSYERIENDNHTWNITASSFLVHDNNIFCICDGTIMKFDADSNSSSPELTSLGISDVICFTISENTLYYATSNDRIYKSNLNGENIEFIDNGYAPVVLKDYIFYYNRDDIMVKLSK